MEAPGAVEEVGEVVEEVEGSSAVEVAVVGAAAAVVVGSQGRDQVQIPDQVLVSLNTAFLSLLTS